MRRWDMATSLGGFCIDVTFPSASHRDFKPYPATAPPCASACSLALNPQKFDYANRSAVFSAQNDRLIYCFAVFERGDFFLAFFRPYCFLSTPTKQTITFFQKMCVIGVFKGWFLWYNIYLVGFFKIFGRIWRI